MYELLTGDALFSDTINFYGEMSPTSKIILGCISVFGVAGLVMLLLSLMSFIISGAPFIATSKNLTRKIVALAKIQPGERVYDLGCGDGRFLIEANKIYAAKAVGIDISPLVCGLAKITVWIKRADVVIRCADFDTYDFLDADVIFCYLVPDQMSVLGEKFKGLKKGCRILSRRFEIHGHEPSQQIQIKNFFGYEPVFIYQI
ncbi:MAG: class I SAM-dependent methyltransferase [Desulfobacterales bacterium]|nr:class I SAM-dependent methyltransferase [Desulfobacterales bacterium]